MLFYSFQSIFYFYYFSDERVRVHIGLAALWVCGPWELTWGSRLGSHSQGPSYHHSPARSRAGLGSSFPCPGHQAAPWGWEWAKSRLRRQPVGGWWILGTMRGSRLSHRLQTQQPDPSVWSGSSSPATYYTWTHTYLQSIHHSTLCVHTWCINIHTQRHIDRINWKLSLQHSSFADR